MNPFRTFLQWVKGFSPTERQSRTQRLLDTLDRSRSEICSRIEGLIREQTATYNTMRLNVEMLHSQTGLRDPATEIYLRSLEKRILYNRRRLQAMKDGRMTTDIDVKQFIGDILSTMDQDTTKKETNK